MFRVSNPVTRGLCVCAYCLFPTVCCVLRAHLTSALFAGSGIAKTVAKSILDGGVADQWMPTVAALCYLPFFVGFALLIKR